MTNKNRCYECIGGPLCGQMMEKPWDADRFVYGDEDNIPHFYRLIRVARNDHSATATFFHYFGNSAKAAAKAHPRLIPPKRLFKRAKKQ
jgi:hypothetical protein